MDCYAYNCFIVNRMQPVAQFILISANTSQDASLLLASEPLVAIGGINPWQLLEFRPSENFYLNSDILDPYLAVNLFGSGYVAPEPTHSDFDVSLRDIPPYVDDDWDVDDVNSDAYTGQR
jgi:hypothetical protein